MGQELRGILIICLIALMLEFCWTTTTTPITTTTTTITTPDNCNSSPCQNGGTCTNSGNGYSCTCVSGYDGTNCENNIDECNSNPCQNGGACSDGVNKYTCSCASGYEGVTCDTESHGQAIFPPTTGCLLILCALSKLISTVF